MWEKVSISEKDIFFDVLTNANFEVLANLIDRFHKARFFWFFQSGTQIFVLTYTICQNVI